MANFILREFRCHDGTPVPVELAGNLLRLIMALESLRRVWNAPITILSGYRTRSWNAHVGGRPACRHLTAEAADVHVLDVAPPQVYEAILRDPRHHGFGGVGLYHGFTHVDIRPQGVNGTLTRWLGIQP
jgi:uncharacterized protein YcbK (DUF882 family)